jgi:hypothetical protein
MRSSAVAVVLAAGLVAAGCIPTARDEVARVTAPSGDVDGVVVERNAVASASPGYEVHLVERGKAPGAATRVASLSGATRNDAAFGVNLRWDALDQLTVEYLDAKTSQVESPVARAAGRAITVVLRPGVRDPTAPAGGMLYNLRAQQR